jgi:flagella basal body P-ring formation protein FlgA
MRCSRRSTRSLSSTAAIAAALAAGLASLAVAQEAGPADVDAAIRAAVCARLGVAGRVSLTGLTVRRLAPATGGSLVATPEPASRLGRVVRFALQYADGRAAGHATARVSVEAPHLRAARDLPRGAVLGPDDVEQVTGDLGRIALRTLPRDVLGARVLLPTAAGAIITPTGVSVPPLVRSGDNVVARVRVPGVEVRGRAVASQDGNLGEIIRAVNPDSRRPLKVRVIARGEVEVVHGS